MNGEALPVIEHLEELVEPELLNIFPFSFLRKNCFIPLKNPGGTIVIAAENPLSLDLGEIREILQKDVTLARAPADLILDCLERFYYHPSSSKKVVDDLKEDEMVHLQTEITDDANLLDLANKAPVIRLVNQIIYRALTMRASDIHLQTTETSFKVRFRIDGILHDIFILPRKYQPAIISRIKIISNLDIAEKRIPQDGRTSIKVEEKQIDIRVSIIPTFFGESAVLRVLDKTTFLYSMNALGLEGTTLTSFDQLIHDDHGIILLTGPTGSGKTTTLYAALSRINKPGINIVTLEDPVEYNLEGINQIQINTKANLTFATGLRSILRHDPDIIMVGEIRDAETADMAIQASLTGHLVFSTLHTNDAATAVTRLLDMGIEPFLLASSLLAVMAQRLVGITCRHCSGPVEPPSQILKDISFIPETGVTPSFREGKGCTQCFNTGSYGMTGIFELLGISERLRTAIMERASSQTLKTIGIEEHMLTLRMDGLRKAGRGTTTIAEVMRVTQEM